jgi:hypothetical protein
LLARYECTKKTRPPAKARFGSVCERLFGITNTRFIHNLAGNTQITRNVRQVTKSVNPKEHASWPLPELYDYLADYLYEVYDTIEHPALGLAPRDAYQRGVAATGGGAVFKGIEQVAQMIPAGGTGAMGPGDTGAPNQINMDRIDEDIRRQSASPQQKMEEIKQGAAYQLGSFIQDAAKEAYAKTPLQDKGAVSQALNSAASAAGGFAPLVASGPLAPATVGLQAAGEGMEQYYKDAIAKGATPQRAADVAMKRALASGAVQAAIFEFLPKPLQKAADKWLRPYPDPAARENIDVALVALVVAMGLENDTHRYDRLLVRLHLSHRILT